MMTNKRILINGQELAFCQSATVEAHKKRRDVWAYGGEKPVGAWREQTVYSILLNRFFPRHVQAFEQPVTPLVDFTITVVEPGRTVHYDGCNWIKMVQGEEGLDGTEHLSAQCVTAPREVFS